MLIIIKVVIVYNFSVSMCVDKAMAMAMLQTHFVESGLEEISVDLHVDKGCPSKPLLQGPP